MPSKLLEQRMKENKYRVCFRFFLFFDHESCGFLGLNSEQLHRLERFSRDGNIAGGIQFHENRTTTRNVSTYVSRWCFIIPIRLSFRVF